MDEFGRDGVLERLLRLDEDADLLFESNKKFNMVIVGGSALILLETITRATLDIDALDVDPDIRFLLRKYDINMQVGAYINNFPYNYEERLCLIKAGKRINFYTASLEDIVIAKLYSNRERDLQDIMNEELLSKINWERLEFLATAENEAKASALNEHSYIEFLENYRDYLRRCRPCGN